MQIIIVETVGLWVLLLLNGFDVIIIAIIPFTAKCNCPASPRRINAAFQVEGARVVLHRMLVLTQCIQPVIKMHYSKQNQGLSNAAAGKGHIR